MKAETIIVNAIPIIGGNTLTKNLVIFFIDSNNVKTQCGSTLVDPTVDPDYNFKCNLPAMSVVV